MCWLLRKNSAAQSLLFLEQKIYYIQIKVTAEITWVQDFTHCLAFHTKHNYSASDSDMQSRDIGHKSLSNKVFPRRMELYVLYVQNTKCHTSSRNYVILHVIYCHHELPRLIRMVWVYSQHKVPRFITSIISTCGDFAGRGS